MASLKKLRLSILLELFLDASLLLLFISQALVVGCLLIYGYLPIPKQWASQFIASQLPPGTRLEVNEFRLNMDGSIELVGIELGTTDIQQALLEANAVEVKLLWHGFSQLPSPESIILSGGTVYIPSVYSPDGYRRPLLERIALRTIPKAGHLTIDRFAALHDSIHLRGSFNLLTKTKATPKKPSTKANVDAFIQSFYEQAAKLSQQQERIDYFINPTIAFKVESIDAQTQQIELRISSHQLRHPEVRAEEVELQGLIQIQEGAIQPLSAPRLTATHLEVPRFQIAAEGLSAELPRERLNGLLAGQWPPLNLAAEKISLQAFELDAPTLQINPQHYPELNFHGATRSLNGAIDLSGHVNTKDRSAHVRARGSVDITKLTPEKMREKLPAITYETPPYLDVSLDFKTGFVLDRAKIKAQVNKLKIDQLSFDHINAHASYQDGHYALEDLYLRRQQQWLDLKFFFDADSYDYKLTLIGSAVPYEYNALLPRWWGSIFKDFDFSQTNYSLGDFIIYGNTKRKVADLYFGHAEARNVSYRDIAFDDAELIVRGRGPYCELRDITTHSGQGWAQGNLAFASRIGDGKGPMSLRIDLDAKLTLEDAAKLFKGSVAKIIADFKTDALPVAQLRGAIFNSKYPEYAGKSFFDLSAKLDAPLSFKDVPLERLSLDLFGRSEITHLRKVEFAYADGSGNAQIDIITPKENSNSLRYQFSLQNADQYQALQGLPQLDKLEDSLETTTESKANLPKNKTARVDIQINGEGPVEDPFKHTGYGRFEIRNEKLGTIQMLGPLSKILQNTYFNFTSFNLNEMRGDFSYMNEIVTFEPLRIDGDRMQINAPGTLRLTDQALDMRVDVSLFGNSGNPDSSLRKISDLIIKPLPNLLEFELSGTVKNQKIRSLYDPRKLIPLFE